MQGPGPHAIPQPPSFNGRHSPRHSFSSADGMLSPREHGEGHHHHRRRGDGEREHRRHGKDRDGERENRRHRRGHRRGGDDGPAPFDNAMPAFFGGPPPMAMGAPFPGAPMAGMPMANVTSQRSHRR